MPLLKTLNKSEKLKWLKFRKSAQWKTETDIFCSEQKDKRESADVQLLREAAFTFLCEQQLHCQLQSPQKKEL